MKSKKIRVFPFRALCPANFTDDGLRWNPISFFKKSESIDSYHL